MDINTSRLMQGAAGSKDTSWTVENIDDGSNTPQALDVRGFRKHTFTGKAPEHIQWLSDTVIMFGGDDWYSHYFWQMTTPNDLSSLVSYDHGGTFNAASGEVHYPYPASWGWRAQWWKPDGTKFFEFSSLLNAAYAPNGPFVRTYTASTPFSYNTLTVDSDYTPSNQTTRSTWDNAYISPDGTKMWLFAYAGFMSESTFSTPWDFSTETSCVTYSAGSSLALLLSDQTAWPSGIEWADNGNKCYLLFNKAYRGAGYIMQLNPATPYSLAGATKVAEISAATGHPILHNQTNFTNGNICTIGIDHLHITSDGLHVYWHNYNDDRLFKGELTTAWDITTFRVTMPAKQALFEPYYYNSPRNGTSFEISADESKVFRIGRTDYNNQPFRLHTYTLTTPGDVHTISRSAESAGLDLSAISGNPHVDLFKSNAQGNLNASNCGNQWMIMNRSTITLGGVSRPPGTVMWCAMEGHYVYTASNDESWIYCFTSTTPYVWTSATTSFHSSYDFETPLVAAGGAYPDNYNVAHWNASGTKLCIAYSIRLAEVNCSTPFDLSTAGTITYTYNPSNGPNVGYPDTYRFNPEMDKLLTWTGSDNSTKGWHSIELLSNGEHPKVAGDFDNSTHIFENNDGALWPFNVHTSPTYYTTWMPNHDGSAIYTFMGGGGSATKQNLGNFNKLSLV